MNEYIKRQYSELEEKVGFFCGRMIASPLIAPEHVYFSLTNRCNLRCKMCDIPTSSAKIEDDLSTQKIKEIITQVKNLNVSHLILSGGEPLLRKDILEIVKFSVGIGIKMVDIITNGLLLDDYIAEELVKSGLNHVTISLDGLSEKHDKVRGPQAFKRATESIDRINSYKLKHKKSSPSVGINFTIMDENIDDMLPMIEFAETKRCNIIVFQPILFSNIKMHTKRKNKLWPSAQNIKALEKVLVEINKIKNQQKGVEVYTDEAVLKQLPNYFHGKRAPKHFKCYEGIKRIVVTCDAKVWSCFGVYGDLNKNSLKEIWLSKQSQKLRKKVKKCKNHCLQDCVYFPSDMINQVKEFFRKESLERKDKEKIKEKLMGKVIEYRKILQEAREVMGLNIFESMEFERELRALDFIISYLERV